MTKQQTHLRAFLISIHTSTLAADSFPFAIVSTAQRIITLLQIIKTRIYLRVFELKNYFSSITIKLPAAEPELIRIV